MRSRRTHDRDDGPIGPSGHRAYAIGDIHGRLDLLDELLGQVAEDIRARPPAKITIVFLGDLIDRGPQSAQVVERLRRYRPSFAKPVFIMGNHEEVVLRILAGDMSILPDWLRFGGAETLRSYGVDPLDLQTRSRAEALKLLRQVIPKDHLKFLSGFVDTASFGGYLFVHAGIRPGVPLAQQIPQDLRWIRSPFLDDEADHGCVSSFTATRSARASTPSTTGSSGHRRLRTGILTALAVEGDIRWLIQTGPLANPDRASARVAKYQHA